MLAFGFEYPMSGRKCARFADDADGEIKNEHRKYIEISYFWFVSSHVFDNYLHIILTVAYNT